MGGVGAGGASPYTEYAKAQDSVSSPAPATLAVVAVAGRLQKLLRAISQALPIANGGGGKRAALPANWR